MIKERKIDEYMARDGHELGCNISDPISGVSGSAGAQQRETPLAATLQQAPQLPQELLPFELQVLEVALGEVGGGRG